MSWSEVYVAYNPSPLKRCSSFVFFDNFFFFLLPILWKKNKRSLHKISYNWFQIPKAQMWFFFLTKSWGSTPTKNLCISMRLKHLKAHLQIDVAVFLRPVPQTDKYLAWIWPRLDFHFESFLPIKSTIDTIPIYLHPWLSFSLLESYLL